MGKVFFSNPQYIWPSIMLLQKETDIVYLVYSD